MNTKEKIITGLMDARQQIRISVDKLPPEKQNEVFLGSWSIKDLLAHLVGWDYTNIEAVDDIRARKLPAVLSKWNPDWAKYNAELVMKYKRDDFKEMLDCVESSHQALVEHVRAIPEEDIEKDFGVRSSWGKNVTMEWFLQAEIDDEGKHNRQIQEWLGKE